MATARGMGGRDAGGWLWGGAVVFFGVGDLLTTTAGLSLGLAVEAHPVAAVVLARHGLAVLVALKVTLLAGIYLAWRAVSIAHENAVPLALALLGVAVTLWNAAVLAIAVLG